MRIEYDTHIWQLAKPPAAMNPTIIGKITTTLSLLSTKLKLIAFKTEVRLEFQ